MVLGLGKLKEKLSGAISKFSGRKDFLEAVCAATALVASADGSVTDDEVVATTKSVTSNPTLTSAFKTKDIEVCIDTMLKRAQSGRAGRAGLYREIEDIKSDSIMCETVYLCAHDVADADGKMEQREREVLSQIASKLGVSPSIANV